MAGNCAACAAATMFLTTQPNTAPHPKRDLGVGLVHKLLKQAGLK